MFGIWFAKNQVMAVSYDGLSSYPIQYFLLTVFKCTLTILILYLFTDRCLAIISNNKLSSLSISLSYVPLLFIYVHAQLYWIALSILIVQLFLLLMTLTKSDYIRLKSDYLLDMVVLCLFLCLHAYLTTRFSPFHWNMSMFSGDGYYTEEVPVLAPLFRGYILSKQYSFSYIDYSQWAGIMNPPITISSTLLQMLSFIFDLPSVSYQSFHIVLSSIIFILFVVGSFGFYLFLRYAVKVHFLFAILGGYLFFFSGSPFLSQMLLADAGVLLSPYAVFPYALLFITLAFEMNNYKFAAWGGAALASQFFFWTPHPEGVIYSLGIYCAYIFSLICFTPQIVMPKKLLIAAISIGMFFFLSAYQLIPIIYDQLTHNMYVFAHTGDASDVPLHDFRFYISLLVFSALTALLFKDKFSAIFKSSMLVSCFIFCVLLVTSRGDVATKIIHISHIGLHFSYPWRLGMYFYFGTFIVFIVALNRLTELLCRLVEWLASTQALNRDNINDQNITITSKH